MYENEELLKQLMPGMSPETRHHMQRLSAWRLQGMNAPCLSFSG
jgi:hypothetical protein